MDQRLPMGKAPPSSGGFGGTDNSTAEVSSLLLANLQVKGAHPTHDVYVKFTLDGNESPDPSMVTTSFDTSNDVARTWPGEVARWNTPGSFAILSGVHITVRRLVRAREWRVGRS